jgi:hypothetical protein
MTYYSKGVFRDKNIMKALGLRSCKAAKIEEDTSLRGYIERVYEWLSEKVLSYDPLAIGDGN